MSGVAGFHYHFYQPPREDPWTGLFNHEWSAWPYHDWNERIAAECYRAMVAVALPEEDGSISLFEPLTQSSFDVGPTLHHWLEAYAPDVERALQHEVRSASRGASRVVVAAPLVHAIVPLATAADQERLVVWGIDDFRARYGEEPVGMWLPETGVDVATLETLARCAITYTVLMPTQAAMTRTPDGPWLTVSPGTLDTSKAYFVALPSGARMTVVFGHHDLSHQVAFGDVLADGNQLADTMAEVLRGSDHAGGAVLLVADGETYGHHHLFGDIGVAWATKMLQEKHHLTTALGEWLAVQTPVHEVRLHEVSAWSCAHGVERWRSDCGCVTGERPGFDLGWRAPLRQALDWLREHAGGALDRELAQHARSSAAALLDYGKVISREWNASDFLQRHQSRELAADERSRVLEICEAHRNLMFSFTSCAWFFADPGEIETSIVLRYAALALELTRRTTGRDFEGAFVERLNSVNSASHDVSGESLWRRACEGFRTDEVQIAAGAAAEFAACGAFARTSRGTWDVEYSALSNGEVRVNLTNTLTLRKSTFLTHCTLGENLNLRVDISDTTMWRRVDLGELGDDVIARVALSRLAGPGSDDVEGALNLLAADLLRRDATGDDAVTLVALASAPRFVSPVSEAALRRALAAVTARDGDKRREILKPLATVLGVAEVVTGTEPTQRTH